MGKIILKMNNIDKYIFDAYGLPLRGTDVKILDSVDFDLQASEVHILIGENGAGKSTLMKIIGGIIPYDSGTFSLYDKPVKFKGPKESLNDGIGFIHQELNLCLNLDVAHNIFLGVELGNKLFCDQKLMYEKSREMLNELGFNIDPHKLVQNLSTAQQQIVEIVKVLSYNCKIIIMDEPTACLTKKEIDKLFNIIRGLKAKGISIIYISHRFEELKEIGDRLTVLRDGKSISTIDMKNFDYDEVIHMMVGRKVSNRFFNTHVPQDKKVLEITDFKISEKTKPFSLYVKEGEVVGLSGLVGAGRTELATSIFGVRKYFGGKVTYKDQDISKSNPKELIGNGLAYLSEDRKLEGLILKMSIKENITISSLKHLFSHGYIDKKEERESVKKDIKELEIISRNCEQLCSTLSGGNQQKVVFSKWLKTNPKMFILDEPTRGIDVKTKSDIYKIIDNLAKQGVAILLISSELPEIIGLSDRIYVMNGGTIVAELTDKEDFTQEKVLSYTVG